MDSSTEKLIKQYLEDISRKLDDAPAREDVRDSQVRVRDEAQIAALSKILEGIAEMKLAIDTVQTTQDEHGGQLKDLQHADEMLNSKFSRLDGDMREVTKRVTKLEKSNEAKKASALTPPPMATLPPLHDLGDERPSGTFVFKDGTIIPKDAAADYERFRKAAAAAAAEEVKRLETEGKAKKFDKFEDRTSNLKWIVITAFVVAFAMAALAVTVHELDVHPPEHHAPAGE